MLENILIGLMAVVFITMIILILIQIGKVAFSFLELVWSIICAVGFYIGGAFLLAFMIIKLPFTFIKKLIVK